MIRCFLQRRGSDRSGRGLGATVARTVPGPRAAVAVGRSWALGGIGGGAGSRAMRASGALPVRPEAAEVGLRHLELPLEDLRLPFAVLLLLVQALVRRLCLVKLRGLLLGRGVELPQLPLQQVRGAPESPRLTP